MAPSRESREHIDKAFKAAKAWGISKAEIKPVLIDLFNAVEGRWEDLAPDGYKIVIDSYFESNRQKGDDGHIDERPRKRPLAGNDANASFSRGSSSKFSLIHSSRNDSDCSIFDLTSVDGSVHRDRASASAVPSSDHMNYFKKPTDNVHTDYATFSGEQTSMRRPGSGNGGARIRRSITSEAKKPPRYISDITKSTEKVAISLVDEVGSENLPKFNYIPQNIVYENAHVNISLSRIAEEDCCFECSGDCLSSPFPCSCALETGGEFVYTPEGLLKEQFLSKRMSPKQEHVFCQDCPLERYKDEDMPEPCKGHVVRKFIKECWRKCGCDMRCGNRVVQRGITCKLQIIQTKGKGWGVRTLEALEKGFFVCEYVGEILTNTELYDRNLKSEGNGRHTYPVTLDGDWGSEQVLRDEDALCLDGTHHGNVARFINHRCGDGNLIDFPVQVETPDRHYYHLAFFTTRKVEALEELTWDYGIDFEDEDHPIKAFKCMCGSQHCRGNIKKERR